MEVVPPHVRETIVASYNFDQGTADAPVDLAGIPMGHRSPGRYSM